MNLVRLAVRQPVSVAVGVILVVLAGLLALQRVPIQLTPDVEDTIIAVTTHWEGASPLEIEQEVVDPQEEKLQGLANLKGISSVCTQGQGVVRLEFTVGTSKDAALREVSDKLRQVPSYPENVDEPVVEASDPQNRDFIAWFILETDSPGFDVRTMKDFADDRVKPVLDRVDGVAEANVLGGIEREVQVRFDPLRLAQHGISPGELTAALQGANRNVSAGAVAESKSDVRLRLVNQFEEVGAVERTVIRTTAAGPIFVRDVATVVETFKEPSTMVRSRGRPVLAINAQKEVGANIMQVMAGLKAAVAKLNEPGQVLDSEARRLGLSAPLTISQVYDQTVYIDDALALVKDNIWLGGALALGVLLVFLGSVRGALIIGLAIPISVVGAVVAMLALGRTVNVISLAGMAFAVGMVVDNAIVVLENIFRHLEMGKSPFRASVDGAEEVYGAVLASTLTTVAVFVPILLVQEEAGQLFRDIALAIVAAVTLSLIVAVTVIPAAAARLLRYAPRKPEGDAGPGLAARISAPFAAIPGLVGRMVYALNGSVLARVGTVVALTLVSIVGTLWLMPPSDYLPQGNRNLVFGLLIPPPGYNMHQLETLAKGVEATIEPYWEAGRGGTQENPNPRNVTLPTVPTFDMAAMAPGPDITPPPLENYFIVSLGPAMFHGGIGADRTKVVDIIPLFQHATRGEVAPGVFAFAQQMPLFRLGGTSGSAVKINFTGDDLDHVTQAALGSFLELMGKYGPGTVQPDPGNFNIPGPELQVVPDTVRLGEVGMTPADLGRAVQALGDGAVIGDYRVGGQTIDLRIVTADHGGVGALSSLEDAPIATPLGGVVPLGSLATLRRVNAASQINREGRRRAVTLQFTAPKELPLEQAIRDLEASMEARRAAGLIPGDVDTTYTGSASKLGAVRGALLGDGTLSGTLASSLFLALLIVYLLMCVLFQSWMSPLVILFSVPLATLGGFGALRAVHAWSVSDRYMPVQSLDVLTMLGFVILIGVVVNNAILIVHQAGNFLRGTADEGGDPMPPRQAISESVRTRVRPIFMSTLTSVLGMIPLVLMPGSGSELYRGLGSVVVGGLIVSTVFTLVLVPLLLSLVWGVQERMGLLDRGRHDDGSPVEPRGGGTGAGPAAAVAVVLLAATALPGCAADHRVRGGEGLRSTLASIAARQVGEVGDGDRPVAMAAADAQLPPELEARRAALEALSGDDEGGDAMEAWGAAPPPLRPLPLREALESSLQYRLGVRALRVDEAAALRAVEREEAAFDGVWFSDVTFDRRDEPARVPTRGGIRFGSEESGEDTWTARTGLRRRTESGATLEAALRFDRRQDSTPGVDLDPDPSWWSGLTLQGRQPLLRGHGSLVNTADIALARTRASRSAEDLREEMLRVAAGTEMAYWDLAEAWRGLRIRADQVKRGEVVEALVRERATFDAGGAERANALATLEFRRADLVRARRLVEAASDRLKAWMGRDDLPPLSPDVLLPGDGFDDEPEIHDPLSAVWAALRERPAVRRAVLDIEDAELREALAENGELASLDAIAGVSLKGLDNDAPAALGDSVDHRFIGWSVGLALEMPLGNRAARATLSEARLRHDASFLRYEDTVRGVIEDVREALREMATARELLTVARTVRLVQAESLRALLAEEERRASLTPEFLSLKLSQEDRLAQARLQEAAARADYHRARAAWWRASGALPAAIKRER